MSSRLVQYEATDPALLQQGLRSKPTTSYQLTNDCILGGQSSITSHPCPDGYNGVNNLQRKNGAPLLTRNRKTGYRRDNLIGRSQCPTRGGMEAAEPHFRGYRCRTDSGIVSKWRCKLRTEAELSSSETARIVPHCTGAIAGIWDGTTKGGRSVALLGRFTEKSSTIMYDSGRVVICRRASHVKKKYVHNSIWLTRASQNEMVFNRRVLSSACARPARESNTMSDGSVETYRGPVDLMNPHPRAGAVLKMGGRGPIGYMRGRDVNSQRGWSVSMENWSQLGTSNLKCLARYQNKDKKRLITAL
ncbi:hypothetical protein LZ30DRAFT_145061 [Colletotrichum cereale]|nr:hypothetical protein LZ30DRAFT_145061 [Colletotrichum cereale]